MRNSVPGPCSMKIQRGLSHTLRATKLSRGHRPRKELTELKARMIIGFKYAVLTICLEALDF